MTNASQPSQNARHSRHAMDSVWGSLTDFAAIDLEATGDLEKLARKILDDPIALQQLSDRVFELLQQDVWAQRDRNCTYGRR